MPGHSRAKDGVASLAYVPGIHVFNLRSCKDVDGRDEPGHNVGYHLLSGFFGPSTGGSDLM